MEDKPFYIHPSHLQFTPLERADRVVRLAEAVRASVAAGMTTEPAEEVARLLTHELEQRKILAEMHREREAVALADLLPPGRRPASSPELV